jgi:hypothetical protein
MGVKLFVDDLRPNPPGWFLARTITEAIRVLSFFEVEVVSLDHDIMHSVPHKTDGPAFEEAVTCPENFSAVAYYIAAMPADRRPKKLIIHTANAAAVYTIIEILKEANLEIERKLYKPENYSDFTDES